MPTYFSKTKYKILLYNTTKTLAGDLTNFVNNLSFGEKLNDFVDCKINLTTNRLPTDLINQFNSKTFLKIYRNGELVWSGVAPKLANTSVDDKNKRDLEITYEHIGKYFMNNAYITKNYNVPTDEGAIFADIIEYSQTAINYNTKFGTTLVDNEVKYGVQTGIVNLTGVVKVFDFSKKETKVIDAIKQLIKAKEGAVENRYFKVSPSFLSPSDGLATFKTGNFGYMQEVFFEYVSTDELGLFTRKTDILGFNKETVKNANFVIGKGDGGLQSVAVSTGYLSSVEPIKIQIVSFKDIQEQGNLDDLTNKKLEVLETPPDIFSLELMPNNQYIGKFSAGQFIKIRLVGMENIDKWFFVLEINIDFDNLTGIEKMSLKIADKEPNEINPTGIIAMLETIQGQSKRLNILES